MYLLEVIATTGFIFLANIYPESGDMAEGCRHDQIFPKARPPSWRWPMLPTRLGDGWHWTPPPPDQCTWCLIQWQNLPKAWPAQSRRRCPFGVAAVRELFPALWGRREGAVSSAQESHGMPVPDRHAPSGLLGVCFLGGSLRSSLKPLGNSLGVFPGSRYLRCPSRRW